jgi:hypothetical protein
LDAQPAQDESAVNLKISSRDIGSPPFGRFRKPDTAAHHPGGTKTHIKHQYVSQIISQPPRSATSESSGVQKHFDSLVEQTRKFYPTGKIEKEYTKAPMIAATPFMQICI